MKRTLIFTIILILLIGSASALRYNVDDTSGRGLYGFQNFTNMSANNFFYNNGTELVNGGSSGGGSGTVTSVSGDGDYVIGTITSSGSFTFNESRLNSTIDSRDSDTTYNNDSSLTLSGTTFGIYDTYVSSKWVNRTDWTSNDNYPSQCAGGNFVYGLGDTLLCAADSDTTYSASGPYIYLVSTIFNFNETLLNITIDARVIPDTNETTRLDNLVGTSCTTGNFIYNFSADGTPQCDAPAGSGDITAVNTNGPYLTGGAVSGDISLLLDESVLNATIDARDSDTTYTASGTLLDLLGTVFSIGEGTLTNGLGCKFVTGTGIVCDQSYSSTVGTVTSVTGTSPIVSSGGTTPAISAIILKDLVTTAPLTGSVNNIFLGTDSDITIGLPVATTSADGYLSQTDWNTFNNKASSDTTYSAGNGISLSTTTFSVAGGTGLTQDASGLSITNDAIGDTQLAFNTGQHLTSTSAVAFLNITVGSGSQGCIYHNGSGIVINGAC